MAVLHSIAAVRRAVRPWRALAVAVTSIVLGLTVWSTPASGAELSDLTFTPDSNLAGVTGGVLVTYTNVTHLASPTRFEFTFPGGYDLSNVEVDYPVGISVLKEMTRPGEVVAPFWQVTGQTVSFVGEPLAVGAGSHMPVSTVGTLVHVKFNGVRNPVTPGPTGPLTVTIVSHDQGTAAGVTIVGGAPEHIALTGPTGLDAGAVSTDFTLSVLDENGVPSPVEEDTTFSLISDSGGTHSFSPAAAVTVPSGASTATFTYQDQQAGPRTVTATWASGDARLDGDSGTHDFTVSPGVADHFRITGDGAAVAGVAEQVTVTAYDALGNVATGYNNASQTLTFSGLGDAPLANGAATIEVAANFSAGGGSAAVAVTGYLAQASTVLHVTAGAVTSNSGDGEGLALSVAPGGADALDLVTPPPASTVAGVAFATAPVVRVIDAYGNHVTAGPGATVEVAVALMVGAGTLSGDLEVTATGGVATFPGLSLDLAGADKVLRFTSGALDAADSDPFAIIPAVASGGHSLLVVTNPIPSVGETVTISVTVRDAFGNNRTAGGDLVAVYLDGAPFASTGAGLTYAGNGTYTAVFTPGAAGERMVRAYLGSDDEGDEVATALDLDASAAAVEASVDLDETGAGEAAEATIRYSSSQAVPPGGAIEVTFPAGFDLEGVEARVSVLAGDYSDAVSVAGQVVTIDLNAMLPTGAITIAFTAGVTNPQALGNAGSFSLRTLDAEGNAIEQDAAFTPVGASDIVPGPPSAAQSLVTADVMTLNANGVGRAKITVTVLDRFGHPHVGASVSFGGHGASDVWWSGEGGPVTDGDGQIVFTVTNTTVEDLVYSFTARGVEVGTAAVDFVQPAVHAGNSTVTPATLSVIADGADRDITVTVRDSDDQPVSGVPVALGQGGGGSVIEDDEVTTDGTGVAVFTVASTKAETVTYTATARGVTLTQTAQITFAPGALDEAATLFQANTTSPTTGGTVTLTLRLRDQHGNRLGAAGDGTEVVVYLGDPDDGGVLFADGASEGETTGDTFTVTYTQGRAGGVTFHAFFGSDAARGAAIGTASVTFAVPPEPAPAPEPRTTPALEPQVTKANEQESPPVPPGARAEVSTNAGDGSTAKVNARPNAVPTGGKVKAAAIGNLEELIEQAPPPAKADVVLAFVLEAEDADGNDVSEFSEPVDLEFTVPASSVPPGTTSGTLVLAFWNGSKWVDVDGTVTFDAETGTYTIQASVTHFTIFAVQHQPDRGTFVPAPVARGIGLTTWGGGGYALLAAALPQGGSVWVTSEGRFTGYKIGAPAFVNAAFTALFPTGVDAGTTLVVVPASE